MKIFLLEAITIDGEHEHRGYCLIRAANSEAAEKLADIQLFQKDDCGLDGDGAYLGFGDNLTASRLAAVKEVNEQEAHALSRLGVAHYVN